MTTLTICPQCAEDMTGHPKCPHCWVVVDPLTLEPRSLDRVVTPIERRVNHRLRACLDEMHAREIREAVASLAERMAS